MNFDALASIAGSTVRLSTPVLCACLAGLWSERAGIVDIGLEGKLLASAFAGATVASLTGSAMIGLGAAVLASLALGMLQGWAAISRGGDQIVCGMSINMIAAGASTLAGAALFAEGGRTPALSGAARFEAGWTGVGATQVQPDPGPGRIRTSLSAVSFSMND